MATYTAKLVDRTGWSEADKHGIQTKAQALFDQAFEGTPDGVAVSWGDGTPGDNLVVHFVADIPHSYLKQKWPQALIDARAIGHTYTGDRPLSGTEVYQTARGSRYPWKMDAITVFHEAMHNLFPFQGKDFVHQLDGGNEAAGMAAAEYGLKSEMTQHNKEMIKRASQSRIRNCYKVGKDRSRPEGGPASTRTSHYKFINGGAWPILSHPLCAPECKGCLATKCEECHGTEHHRSVL